jgi:hypothetical protein
VTEDERRVAERRTLATRGPGTYTPAQSAAASNPCLNCGTNVQLEFCPECGQRVVEPDPTLRELLHEMAEEFLHWDGKLATTFRTLIVKPGALTLEYLNGRRVPYVSPLRVYLTCSVLYFFLGAVVPDRVVIGKDGQAVKQGMVKVSETTERDLAGLDSAANSTSLIQRVWFTHFARAMRAPEQLQRSTQAAIPKAMFVLVPLFAALIGVVYRDRRRRYPQHLAFALHIHAALFLTLTAMLVGRFVSNVVVAAAIQALLVIPFVIYLVRATRVVYDGSRAQTIGRLLMACTLYFFGFLLVIGTLFVLIVLAS